METLESLKTWTRRPVVWFAALRYCISSCDDDAAGGGFLMQGLRLNFLALVQVLRVFVEADTLAAKTAEKYQAGWQYGARTQTSLFP